MTKDTELKNISPRNEPNRLSFLDIGNDMTTADSAQRGGELNID